MNTPTHFPYHVLIPCAGFGSRMGANTPKQFQLIHGKTVIQHTIKAFFAMPQITSIWVGLSPQNPDRLQAVGLSEFMVQSPRLNLVNTGGASRADTVLNTLQEMQSSGISADDWVLVHDAARPGVQPKLIEALIQAVEDSPGVCGGILAIPVADTLKIDTQDNTSRIAKTLSRKSLWQAQTPQMFRIGDLTDALTKASQNGLEITDEASAFEYLGQKPLLVEGSSENFKITYPADLLYMRKILKNDSLRIGQGYDVHRLVVGRALILGGVHIPSEVGLLGHSDADALIHALIDSLLGALGLGDIGRHFPDTDPQYAGAISSDLLLEVLQMVKKEGFGVINVDATIICQTPKLAQFIPLMTGHLSKLMQIDQARINIKAKTNEGLGYLGQAEAIEAQVVVLLGA